MIEQAKKKGAKAGSKKDKKKFQLQSHDGKIDEHEELDADDEAEKNSSRRSKGKDSLDKDEEKDKVVDLKDQDAGQVVHKKRRRKNVESRDVSTQTDRSDYMLIKQRQQEKQLKALLAQKNANKATDGEGNKDAGAAHLEQSVDGSVHHKLMRPTLLGGGIQPHQVAKGGGPRDNLIGGMQGAGQVHQAVHQNLLRQDLKSFLGASSVKDQALTQAFLEDYLTRQKQGLVDNIVSQYAQDAQKLEHIHFSNAII